MKEYLASEFVAEIPKLGKVKLVVSKKENENEKPNFFFFFYMSTDLCLTLEEVLEMENRWSIELAHREADQKFGFRDYQIRDKRAIKLIQLSFLAWTIIHNS